jgi:hypothetical protein
MVSGNFGFATKKYGKPAQHSMPAAFTLVSAVGTTSTVSKLETPNLKSSWNLACPISKHQCTTNLARL